MSLACIRRGGTYTKSSITDADSFWAQFYTFDEVYEIDAPPAQPVAETAAGGIAIARASRTSVVQIHSLRERVKSRFRLLKRLRNNHDNEGASAANKKSVDIAISFIDKMTAYPEFFATLDDDGSAVIEFENKADGFYADIKFNAEGTIDCYRRLAGQRSETFFGDLNSEGAKQFLERELRIQLS